MSHFFKCASVKHSFVVISFIGNGGMFPAVTGCATKFLPKSYRSFPHTVWTSTRRHAEGLREERIRSFFTSFLAVWEKLMRTHQHLPFRKHSAARPSPEECRRRAKVWLRKWSSRGTNAVRSLC